MSIAYLLGFHIIFLFSLWQVSLGHGYVHSVVVGGQSYPGWNPFSDPYASGPPKIVRKVGSDGPVPITNPDIACNIGGNEGTTAIASAQAGSQVVFQWAYWPGEHQGPISTYMASCNGDCSKFSANDARWFKVDAQGYDPSSRQWAAAKLIADGGSWTSTIPNGLAPGQYLMRNEIIALHSSPAQFYPMCSQIEVTGSGTGQPSDSSLVSMQTLYKGVEFPNIYSDKVSFAIPGPAPVDFGGSGGGGGGSMTPSTSVRPSTSSSLSSSTASTYSSNAPGPTSIPVPTSTTSVPTSTSVGPNEPTQQCHLGTKKQLKRRS